MTTKTAVIIPTYNPDEKLLDVIDGLRKNGLTDIIIVNDGSDSDRSGIFDRIQNCTVLVHDKNQGKGSALKTAFSYCAHNALEYTGFVTVDGDGQHLPEDVVACSEAIKEDSMTLVLGCRTFGKDKQQIPIRSRFGNQLTRKIFQLGYGIKVSDTQTGLRAFSRQLLPLLLQIPGERYEYESNMLITLRKEGVSFVEVPIHTVYLEENSTSHFNPFADSLRIYKEIFQLKKFIGFMIASLSSTGIDLLLFTLISVLLNNMDLPVTVQVFAATIVARICSSLCNYFCNKKLVFRNGNTSSLWKYYLLCICQMLVSASLVNGVVVMFHISSLLRTVIKAIVDTTLFFASFVIQKNWVFGGAKKD